MSLLTFYLPIAFIIQYIAALFVYLQRKKNLVGLRPDEQLKQKKLMVVFGSGGHTTEMLLMLDRLDPRKYKRVYMVIALTDNWSLTKIKDYLKNHAHCKIDLDKVELLNE
jgi:hypothetical protein